MPEMQADFQHQLEWRGLSGWVGYIVLPRYASVPAYLLHHAG